jgi:hypothetical protein
MTSPLGKLGSVSSVVAASLYQGNHNRNYELRNINYNAFNFLFSISAFSFRSHYQVGKC